MNARILAAMIVKQAIDEWKTVCKGYISPTKYYRNVQVHHWENTTAYLQFAEAVCSKKDRIEELRRFFTSAWCDCLLCGEGEGEDILRMLEPLYGKSKIKKQIDNLTKGAESRWMDA